MTPAIDYIAAHPWLLWLVAGVISLVIARRSQIDEWANSKPRLAGLMKLLRGLGIDPWLILQSLSLLIHGRLPKEPTPKLQDEPPSTKRPPTLPLAMLMLVLACLGLSSCSNWKPAARTASDLARDMCSLFFAEAQGISFEDAARTACDTHEKVKPFLDELLRAQEVAGAKAGLQK